MKPTLSVPPPPEDPHALLEWASKFEVQTRLDDLFVATDGPAGTFYPGRRGEKLTYRDLLIDQASLPYWQRHHFEEAAREFLQRMASLIFDHRAARAWMNEHGRDPTDEALSALLEALREAQSELARARARAPHTAARPTGTYEPVTVTVLREPVPVLDYEETTLSDLYADAGPRDHVGILLLAWNEGPLRWTRTRGGLLVPGDVSPDQKQSALETMIDFMRDPRAAEAHETLAELLRLPAWRFALGTMDEGLSRIGAIGNPHDGRGAANRGGSRLDAGGVPGRPEERVAFRVTVTARGALDIEPLVQRRGRGGRFSKGARINWYSLVGRRDLTESDRRAFNAFGDRFVDAPATRVAVDGGTGMSMGAATMTYAFAPGAMTPARTFGILRALLDHPAVFLDTDRGAAADSPYDGGRLDIRQGRLRLRFVSAPDNSLAPQFELLGVTLLPSEVAQSLRDSRHLMLLHRHGDGERAPAAHPSQPPQMLLAEVTPEAAAVVRALALAPARFPPEAHDALAARLESLQEAMDIEFPSQWTRTIGPADGRLVVRLELLASGALQVRFAVRPVKLGPVFAPGEGPALVLEGQGRERHGARRDRQAERQAAHAWAERLSLGGGEETAPWCWRVGEGDLALHLVASLKELGDEAVTVEWADDARLIAMGSVGRADMRMKVADRRDWFAVGGGAAVKAAELAPAGSGKRQRSRARGNGSGAAGTEASEVEIVPLAELLAAIREERRYVRVGAHGFVRIEDSLREALARAEGALFTERNAIQVSSVSHESLLGLVEDEAQIEATVAFVDLRRRMKEGAEVTAHLSPTLEQTLRPYQKAGVAWMARLAHWGAGALLADEMGLGKTIQTLALLLHRAALGPALVVAPTSVVGNWVDEAARFAPELKLRLYRGTEREAVLRGIGPGDLVVTSYAIAVLDADALATHTFASLVLDEAQAVKNAATERAKALRGLNASWRLGLTGTPIENHLGELWSLLRVISPGLLGSWEQFRGRYAVPIEKYGDDGRRQSLSALLRPFVLRRMKAEVARELPARTELVKMVQLSPEEQQLYEELRLSTLDELTNKKKDRDRDAQDLRFVLLAALTRLRQLCCHPRLVYPRTHAGSTKAAYLLQLLDELREGGHKALVFSQFRSFLELLQPRLVQHGFRVLVLDGTTPSETRERRIAAFQAGEADVFLISLKAGGFGLNLTAADTVIHLDPWWNPAVEDQATSRAHRIGQERPVTAVRLVARGTIEEAVLSLHAAKRALAAAVLEGSDVAAKLGTDELMDLIRRGSATVVG